MKGRERKRKKMRREGEGKESAGEWREGRVGECCGVQKILKIDPAESAVAAYLSHCEPGNVSI